MSLLERINRGERVRVCVHTPPRHGKTETLLHFIAYCLKHHVDWTFAYCSYNDDIASSKGAIALDLIKRAGIALKRAAVGESRTHHRGGLLVRGIGGGLTGHGVNVGIIDDPVKDRAQAESAVYREKAKDWFRYVFRTRIMPNGSIIVNMARWHPDDLSGWLIKEHDFEYLCLPALTPDPATGEETPLWPDVWPLHELNLLRSDLGPYAWESLYQGAPRPRGGTVFGDPWVWTELPPRYKAGIGLDFAYTQKTSSDYSVLVVMLRDDAGFLFVVDVVRVQVRAPQFMEVVKRYMAKYPGARVRWYAYGPEQGVGDFMHENRMPIEAISARGDKFVRSLPYAASWNNGRVLVPENSAKHPWVDKFLVEHLNFTGVEDDHDDQVDAAGACHDVLHTPYRSYDGMPEKRPGGQRRM